MKSLEQVRVLSGTVAETTPFPSRNADIVSASAAPGQARSQPCASHWAESRLHICKLLGRNSCVLAQTDRRSMINDENLLTFAYWPFVHFHL